MALLLERENDPLSPQKKGNLRCITIKDSPIDIGEKTKAPVTGRGRTVYTLTVPERVECWKRNYDRRLTQLKEHGLHSDPEKPYKDIGDEVQLDDAQLILDALGQEIPVVSKMTKKISSEPTLPPIVGPPNIRARTPSQFSHEMLSLHEVVKQANDELFFATREKGLFEIMRKEQIRKEEEELALSKEMDIETTDCWREAIVEDLTSLKLTMEDSSDNENNSVEGDETNSQSTATLQLSSSKSNQLAEHIYTVEVSLREKWYRELCVILWVLEAMRMDSPSYMPSLHSFWKINRPMPDPLVGQKVHDRKQSLFKQWDHITGSKLSPKKVQKRTMTGLIVAGHNNTTCTADATTTVHANKSNKSEGTKLTRKFPKQRKSKLNPEQMEQLTIMVEEELNKSKKETRNAIKQLKQASMQRPQTSVEKPIFTKKVNLDIEQCCELLKQVDDEQKMIVNEQLSVMQRERQPANEQRFSSLQVSNGLWKDLAQMRKGVAIESATMAHNKLLMNYDWIPTLLSLLPSVVLSDRYCVAILQRLRELQQYMRTVGPHVMSQQKLISVLSSFRMWELSSPEIADGIEFITNNVVYVVPEDYHKWFLYHSAKIKRSNQAEINKP